MLRPMLVVTAFLCAAAVLVLEILAGRLLAPYVGMSVYTWTAIISTVLAGLALGNWCGGFLARGRTQTDLRRLGIVLLLASIATVCILLLAKPLAAAILSRTDSAMTSVVLMSAGLFFLPAFFGGMVSPIIATAVVSMTPSKAGRALGAVYAAGSAGAIAGSAGSGFILIPYFGSARATLAAAAVLGILGTVWLLSSGSRRRAVVGLAAVTTLAVIAERSWQHVCDAESATFCIRIVGLDGPEAASSRIRAMILDHLVHGINVEDAPQALLSPYTAQIDHAARQLQPKAQSAFFVGGGSYSLPRAWARMEQIVVAEIDPTVTRVAQAHFWVDASGMEILHQDARLALGRQPDASFDLIVGDAFKDVAAPFHLLTLEFAALVARKLRPGGIYFLNLVDRMPDARALRAVVSTLGEVFPTVLAWREDQPSAGPNRHTFVIMATEEPAHSLAAAEAKLEGWIHHAFDQSDGMAAHILTDDHAPLEHLLGLASDSID